MARIVIPGAPYHPTQRGNRRQPIVFSDADRILYLDLLRQGGGARHAVSHYLPCR